MLSYATVGRQQFLLAEIVTNTTCAGSWTSWEECKDVIMGGFPTGQSGGRSQELEAEVANGEGGGRGLMPQTIY